jgi:hypothetical protein
MKPDSLLVEPDSAVGKAVATGLGDPSITLVESGPALGLLIAETCHEDRYSGRLFLDRVTWVRGDESVRAVRDFASVCLQRAEHGVWVAEETGSGRLFPRPSRLPYRVEFIPADDYRLLTASAARGNTEAIFDYARTRFGGLPGFRLRNRQLVPPREYATAGDPPGREYVS